MHYTTNVLIQYNIVVTYSFEKSSKLPLVTTTCEAPHHISQNDQTFEYFVSVYKYAFTRSILATHKQIPQESLRKTKQKKKELLKSQNFL